MLRLPIKSWLDESKNFSSRAFHLKVDGLNMNVDLDTSIKECCVIQGPLAKRAAESVVGLGMEPIIFPSFNILDRIGEIGVEDYNTTNIRTINPPTEYKHQDWTKHVKLVQSRLTHREICRILNHMAIWNYCVVNNKSVIVLEHDALLLKRHTENIPRNSINMLSDFFLSEHTDNFIYGAGVHAYSLDQFSAKRLFNKVMDQGITDPLEFLFRLDEFSLVCHKKAIKVHNFVSMDEILAS